MSVKTAREKALAGESYNCLDPDLEARRQVTRKLLRLYNRTETVPEQQAILRQLLGQIATMKTECFTPKNENYKPVFVATLEECMKQIRILHTNK